MTITAVGMDLDHFVGIALQIRLRIVLMRMMAEMLRACFTFMLAIRSSRSPAELERQQREQKDED